MPFFKQIQFKFIILALILTGIAVYLLLKANDPYKLTVKESIIELQGDHIYHDFDNDGFSESLECINEPF